MFFTSWLMFMIFGLATFRITRLLVFDQIMHPLRKLFMDEMEIKDELGNTNIYVKPKKGIIKNFIGELLSCYWCTGIWISLIIFIGYRLCKPITEVVIIIFAVAGLAAIIETIIHKIT